MKKLIFAVFVSLLAGTAAYSQDAGEAKPAGSKTITISESKKQPTAPVKTRGPVFRPTKEQIRQVQAMLKEKSLYSGEASGSYNDETRAGIRNWQKSNGLKETGTLNRETLEKMNIELTESQKAIPAAASSPAPAADAEAAKRSPIFRATKEQVKEAQRILRSRSLYSGEETGKLDDATRAALKKYQEANSLKATGTLNQATLEAMGIALTEKQKAPAEEQK